MKNSNIVHKNFWSNFNSTHLGLTDKGGGFTSHDALSVKKSSTSTYIINGDTKDPFFLTNPKDFLKTIQMVEGMTQYNLFGKDYLVKELLEVVCVLLYIQTLSNFVDEAKNTLDDTEETLAT